MIIEIRRNEESQDAFDDFCDKIITDVSTMRRRIGQKLSIKSIDRSSWEMTVNIDVTEVKASKLDEFLDDGY